MKNSARAQRMLKENLIKIFKKHKMAKNDSLFPYKYWVFEEKPRFGPVSELPGPKRVSGNCQKWAKATGRNCVAGPFMHES